MADQAPGPGVDARGRPVDDPTANVLDLVRAAVLRLDDMATLRDTMAGQRAAHERYVAELRADYDRQLRATETARLNAIRDVDIGAVQRAAEVQLASAGTLATQTATMAETLRAGQAAAVALTQTNLTAALDPIQKDIADLRRVQYEQVGAVAQTVETRATTGESRLNVGMIVGIAGALLAVVGVGCTGLAIAVSIVVAVAR